LPNLKRTKEDKTMKRKGTTLVLAAAMLASAHAQTTPGKLDRLPDTLPPSVEARVGKVDFRRGMPTETGIE
jgi:hypothetical protein